MDRIRVAVLMGGPSSEHEVSLRSGANVVDALDPRRYEVRPVIVTREGHWKIAVKAPVRTVGASKSGRPSGFDPLSNDTPWREHDHVGVALTDLLAWRTDVALPILHGRFGEDGTVQACLAAAGIPFAGSGVRGSALAADKVHTKEVLAFHGLRTARFRVVTRDDLSRGRQALAAEVVEMLGAPVVVKDPLGGSSLEVRVCDDARAVTLAFDALGRSADRLLVEAFVAGREFTGGVLDEFERSRPLALPLVELKPRSARFFDHREKYDPDGALELCPADLPPELEATGRAVALKVHALLGLRGVSRTDMILSASGDRAAATGLREWVVLETNTMPGMTSRSLLPKAAAAAGVDFAGVVERLVRSAGLDG